MDASAILRRTCPSTVLKIERKTKIINPLVTEDANIIPFIRYKKIAALHNLSFVFVNASIKSKI